MLRDDLIFVVIPQAGLDDEGDGDGFKTDGKYLSLLG